MLSSNSTLENQSPIARPPIARPRLGIVGCGNIGGKQAANFLDHGYPVYIYDINPDSMTKLQGLGARITHSCTELATCSDIIFSCLPTPADVITAVLEGENNLSQGLRSGSVYVDMTTNSPETVLRLHKAMGKLGVEMLDAPFNDCPVGGHSQRGMGLAVLASGSQVTFERIKPILELMADRVLYCGEIGSGTRCKLIHNAVNAAAVQAVSEGITLGLSQGIPLQTIWDALRFGAFGQNAGDIHGLPHYWFSRRCDDLSQHPAFTVKLLHKDLRLALGMANEQNISVPQIALTAKDYQAAEAKGWSDYATTKVRCLQEERAGVIAGATVPLKAKQTENDSPGKGRWFLSKGLTKVLTFLLVTNLLQLGFYWLFHSHY